MKVIEKDMQTTVNFEDIHIGECFTYGGDYYLKIEELLYGGIKINVVDVEDGRTATFCKKDQVTPIDANFVVL